MTKASRRWRALLAVVALAAALVLAVAPIRASILRAAGWALVVDEHPTAAEFIVVGVDAGGAGVLEAADLVHAGIASRVAVLADPPDATDREFLRRGVPYEDVAARSTRQLHSLGVTAVEEIPRVTGTADEGSVLPQWCAEGGLRTVIIVTTRDHSRRLHRVLRRSLQGQSTRVTIRSSRYSTFDPDHWWQTRSGIRIEIVELQKLMLDVVLHPFS